MKLIEILRRPFPHETSFRSRLGMAVFFGVFVFGFLIIFKPFHLDNYPSRQLALICSVYGLVTFSCLFLASLLLPLIFPSFFAEENWTTGKEILLVTTMVIFVGLMNYLVSPLIVDTKLNFQDALWFQGITITIALLPITIFILLRQIRLLRKFSEQAKILEEKLKEKKNSREDKIETEKQASAPIIFTGDYQNEKVEIHPEQLYVITSASNYIKVYYRKNGKTEYSVIRSTLKKAEENLGGLPLFFRCHRAYIINLDRVVQVEGNAQGYKIRIDGYDETIPVSRNLNNEFSDKLLAYRKQQV